MSYPYKILDSPQFSTTPIVCQNWPTSRVWLLSQTRKLLLL